jgi:hypothetical protein
MNAIDRIRQDLEQLLAETSAAHHDLDQRELEIAQAAEQLSQDTSVQAAWQHGCRHERERVITLIDHQLDQLRRGGTNATVLQALRRMVLEAQP